jgi:hypothetical protein
MITTIVCSAVYPAPRLWKFFSSGAIGYWWSSCNSIACCKGSARAIFSVSVLYCKWVIIINEPTTITDFVTIRFPWIVMMILTLYISDLYLYENDLNIDLDMVVWMWPLVCHQKIPKYQKIPKSGELKLITFDLEYYPCDKVDDFRSPILYHFALHLQYRSDQGQFVTGCWDGWVCRTKIHSLNFMKLVESNSCKHKHILHILFETHPKEHWKTSRENPTA